MVILLGLAAAVLYGSGDFLGGTRRWPDGRLLLASGSADGMVRL